MTAALVFTTAATLVGADFACKVCFSNCGFDTYCKTETGLCFHIQIRFRPNLSELCMYCYLYALGWAQVNTVVNTRFSVT